MKKTGLIIFCLTMMIITTTQAQNPPLRVGISNYKPPFVMHTGNKNFYGFDISMMEYICEILQRTCQYVPMPFGDLIKAVENKQVDVASSAITITAERAQVVNFSVPYLPSESRFLASAKLGSVPFTLQLLENKRIGVEAGTIFANQIKSLRIKNASIKDYDNESELVEALSEDEIDLALLDAASALYWQSHSSHILKAIGIKLPHGFGFGIALNRESAPLLQAINQALDSYHKSAAFKKDYHMYLEEF